MKRIELKPEEDGVVEETLIFSLDELAAFLREIQWHTGSDGVILNDHNAPITCAACGKVLRVNDFGAFLKGSLEAVCGDFACFAGAIFYRDVRRLGR